MKGGMDKEEEKDWICECSEEVVGLRNLKPGI
jgi:hypothetical protein